jgi:ABC-2 type transport system permease protein
MSTTMASGGRTAAVSWAIARRSLVNITRLPSAFVPSLIMPVFFTVAFGGAFGAVTRAFGVENALNWFVPFAALQGSAFAGLGVSFGVIRDLENRFFDRLLMAPTARRTLLAGPLLAALLRTPLPIAVVTVVGLLGGMRFSDGLLGFVMLAATSLGVAVAACAWGLGLAYRIKTMAAAALMQVGIFVTLFLSTAQVPLEFMEGWLEPVARLNPATRLFTMARQGLLGEVAWSTTWPGLLALGTFLVVTLAFAARGLRRLVP